MGRFFATFFFYLLAFAVPAQDISGYWQGVLRITKQDSLTIGMVVEQQGDSLNVVMDSPDQYYMDIATNESQWKVSRFFKKSAEFPAAL